MLYFFAKITNYEKLRIVIERIVGVIVSCSSKESNTILQTKKL